MSSNKPIILLLLTLATCKVFCIEEKNKINKDPRDYTDADLEKLLNQWDEDEDPVPEDELPQHLRKKPPTPPINMNAKYIANFVDLSSLNVEEMMAKQKKGQQTMAFVEVADVTSESDMDEITRLWQQSLANNHVDLQRYIVEGNRALFLFKDGERAYESVKWLIDQDRCVEVTLDSKVIPGKAIARKLPDENDKKQEL